LLTATPSKFTARASGSGASPRRRAASRDGDAKQFRCGAKAANELDAFIADRPVTCIEVGQDRYGRTVGVCTVDNIDLADWLVRASVSHSIRRNMVGAHMPTRSGRPSRMSADFERIVS